VSDTKVYDGTTDSDETPTYVGLATGDSLTGLTQAFQSKNVLGTNGSTLVVDAGYTLDDGNGGNNYDVDTETASGTIRSDRSAMGTRTSSAWPIASSEASSVSPVIRSLREVAG